MTRPVDATCCEADRQCPQQSCVSVSGRCDSCGRMSERPETGEGEGQPLTGKQPVWETVRKATTTLRIEEMVL